MKLHEMIEGVSSKEDLAAFVSALAADFQSKPAEWENDTVERFLSALARWLLDSDVYHRNGGLAVPVDPSWRNVAEMLLAAKMYE